LTLRLFAAPYPSDEQIQGKELRLQQQYIFVSCSLRDMPRILHVQTIPRSGSARSSWSGATTPTRP